MIFLHRRKCVTNLGRSFHLYVVLFHELPKHELGPLLEHGMPPLESVIHIGQFEKSRICSFLDKNRLACFLSYYLGFKILGSYHELRKVVFSHDAIASWTILVLLEMGATAF